VHAWRLMQCTVLAGPRFDSSEEETKATKSSRTGGIDSRCGLDRAWAAPPAVSDEADQGIKLLLGERFGPPVRGDVGAGQQGFAAQSAQ
jgi:hypothetical protein